jgi:hypothetical protein
MDTKEPKYSQRQVFGLILVVIFIIYTETTMFKSMPDLTRAGVLITFSIVATIIGVKKGGIKEILEQVKPILESQETTEEILEEIQNLMHYLAVKAGIIWTKLGVIVQTKLGKLKEKIRKKAEVPKPVEPKPAPIVKPTE